MKVALAVPHITSDIQANREGLYDLIKQAAAVQAELVLLPEAALTGLINNGDPGHDLPLGQPIPGPFVSSLGERASRHRMWLATGLLEREKGRLYDSAVLLDPRGKIALRYRRIQPQWHGKSANPAVYREGKALSVTPTPFGRCLFLICGDLFDDQILDRACRLAPDLVLFPFARCFPNGVHDQRRWDEEELPCYAERIAALGGQALLVNHVAEPTLLGGAFGGAWVIDQQGNVRCQRPLGQPGLLVTEIPLP
jgi:N-carbamoylputrescine amidase